jgi:uncharacterized protein
MSEEKVENKSIYLFRVLASFIPYVFILGIFHTLVTLMLGYKIEKDKEILYTLNDLLIIHSVLMIVSILFVFLLVRKVEKLPFIEVGFKKTKAMHEGILGFLLGTTMIVLGTFIMIYFGWISIKWYYPNPLLIGKFLLLFLFTAIGEEVYFRGFVLRNYMGADSNKHVALAYSAMLFGFMHTFNPNSSPFGIAQIVVSGILLGSVYVFTKRIWFGIGMHVSWNFAQAVIGFPISGNLINATNKITLISENELYHGGKFGFEGSIISMILIILSLVGIFYYYDWYKEKQNSK